MPVYKKRPDFFTSEEGLEVLDSLRLMMNDMAYSTPASYSSNSETYPDNLIPFVDKHMEYLRSHPTVNPQHYLSNLRLMTRKKLVK